MGATTFADMAVISDPAVAVDEERCESAASLVKTETLPTFEVRTAPSAHDSTAVQRR
jgi:hypothetical protein